MLKTNSAVRLLGGRCGVATARQVRLTPLMLRTRRCASTRLRISSAAQRLACARCGSARAAARRRRRPRRARAAAPPAQRAHQFEGSAPQKPTLSPRKLKPCSTSPTRTKPSATLRSSRSRARRSRRPPRRPTLARRRPPDQPAARVCVRVCRATRRWSRRSRGRAVTLSDEAAAEASRADAGVCRARTPAATVVGRRAAHAGGRVARLAATPGRTPVAPSAAPVKRYAYDAVCAPDRGQTDVFAECVGPIDAALGGSNGTIFAYGQTARARRTR